jgi:hypothetical protein
MNLDDITNSEIDRLINEYIHSERDRKILHRRLIDGICYEPLADEMGMSVRQIKNIVYIKPKSDYLDICKIRPKIAPPFH